MKQMPMTWSYIWFLEVPGTGKLNGWIMLWTWNYLASSILLLWKRYDLDHLDARWWFCNLNTKSTEVIPCEVWTTELLYGQRRNPAGATVKGTLKWLLYHQIAEVSFSRLQLYPDDRWLFECLQAHPLATFILIKLIVLFVEQNTCKNNEIDVVEFFMQQWEN